MKIFALALTALLLISGCSNEESTLTRIVPSDCEFADVISAFDEQVTGAKYIPTQWEPAEGTDLAAVYDAGGIACSYGIQEAEVGGTIMWAPADKNELWAERAAQWQASGQTAIDLEGVDETAAFILQEGTSADEMHVWTINILNDGIWIQIGATFLQTVDEASAIIDAAIAATEG